VRTRNKSVSRSVALAGLFGVGAALMAPLPATAATTDVVINEIMYNPASGVDGEEFLELTNTGSAPVDMSGWTFTSGITATLPAGATIPAGGFYVLSPDPARYQSTYRKTANAVYTGKLDNGGETVTLVDATGSAVDSVAYETADPWATTPDGDGPSLELVDATADRTDPRDWAASTATSGETPGAANSVRRSTGLGPSITNVTPSTTTPAPNTPLTVTATVSGQTSTPTLKYRIDFGTEQTVTMQAGAGNDFTASIPGAAAGHLIRYRVVATNAAATTTLPRVDDSAVYRGVVVPTTISKPIKTLEWFISDTDYNAITANPTADVERQGALAYNGTVVDNVTMSIKGHASRKDPKQSWKFTLPKNYSFDFGLADPVDEFAMQADWSDKSHGRSTLSYDAYQRAGVVNEELFPMQTLRNGAFQGFYTYEDSYDGTWRKREGYDDKQFYKAETSAFDGRTAANVQFTKKAPDTTDYAPLQSLLSGVALTGTAQKNYMLANTDIPELIDYAAVTAIIDHEDSSSKNFYVAQDPDNGRWSIIPWDLDHTIGNGCCGINSNFVTPAEPGDKQNKLLSDLLAVPEWKSMYFRRLRTLVDDILAPGRMEALYDAKIGPAQSVIQQDYTKWPYSGASYANYRKYLFTAIQARRTAFANDSRVPAKQSASPNIVIDEIQTGSLNGDTEFIEVYNPSATEAVDLSGWTLGNAIDTLPIQPGTVVLPHGYMTFVANDTVFRQTYGSTVFVGGQYSGGLKDTSEQIDLTRPDGSLADSVKYEADSSWPAVTGKTNSLELQNLGADNNVGSNWALSQSATGTPGAANGGTSVVTAPGAPTIGTATAGNGSATVTWTAPSSDGGSAITGYDVRVVDNTTGNQVGNLRPAGASATSLTVTGLTSATSYKLQVAATNSVGDGAYSAFSNVVTPSGGGTGTVPGAPVIGAPTRGASGGALTAVAHWTPPASAGSSPITGYRVTALQMSSSSSSATVIGTKVDTKVVGASVRQRAMTLTSGNWRFTVVAINAAGSSAPSARSANVVPR
jgi:CotH protein/lamin tail-like protein/fibronectin type III domain protein